MEPRKPILPPRWATRLLSWYCKPELLEDLEGDLLEYFQRNLSTKGTLRAKSIYILDAIKFFRLYTIRKPELLHLLINWIMLGSYIKTSGRNIVRNKLFSAINIVGLAVSMSVGLILISVISDTLSYDRFNVHHSNIYRIVSRYEYLGNKDDDYMATTSPKVARMVKEEFSAPKEVAVFHRGYDGDFKIDDRTIPLKGMWANEAVLRVFTIDMIKGNPEKALSDPFSVVLTDESEKKLFGLEESLGKVIYLHDKSYTVTGVVRKMPQFSHIKFDVLGSFSTRPILEKNRDEESWDNVWSTWVYLLLPDGTDLDALKARLDELSQREDPTVKNTHIELKLQALDNIMTGENLGNEIGPVLGSSILWIFSSLAFVVILSACFNYTNLSIARSLKRTREVGVRKVIGAMKAHVIGQFVVEAVVISLCSFAVSLLLFILLKPFLISTGPNLDKLLTMELSPLLIAYFIVFAVSIGAVAGFFPALFFSKVNVAHVLKNMQTVRVFRKLTVRKMLIVIQYCISIIMVTSTMIMYQQYRHYVSFDLGFQTDNVLNITLNGNKPEILRKEFSEVPEVTSIAQSSMVTSVGNYWGTNMKYHGNPLDSAGVYFNMIDENYIPFFRIQLLAGRNFLNRSDSAKETEVIVNEQVLKRFNIAGGDPLKAIDDMVILDGKEMKIIGVMKDFQYGRANDRNQQKEVALRFAPKSAEIMSLKITTSDVFATYSKLESIWKKIDTVHPFEAKFYSEQIEKGFSGLIAAVKVVGFLAFLTISIASMGMLGMVVFTTETRLKEISIRKVMGATEGNLLYLLSKSFIILLAIAAGISLPLTAIFFQQIAFPELANHAPLGFGDLFWGVFAILLLALLMIGSQTFKVARTNPADVLKSE
ncbi:MAG: ABC transporter permease [Bacteroidetes bacterium]|nr:ABC transporter permease [Bacteroidota bacterium]